MANPLYNLLNNKHVGNAQNIMDGVNQLKSTLNVNPEQYIASMLNSGQITQAQIDQARRMASMLGIKV